ncbi:hypothetical protein ABPG72_011347 [Tetrahymena utriculariae]
MNMKNLNSTNLKNLQISLQQERSILYSILGQEELLERFVASLFCDKKIIQEAYKLYCLISQDKSNQKNLIRFQLESSFCHIYQIKQLFYQYEAAIKELLAKSSKNSHIIFIYNQLKNYFEQQLIEEVEEIPDELPSE